MKFLLLLLSVLCITNILSAQQTLRFGYEFRPADFAGGQKTLMWKDAAGAFQSKGFTSVLRGTVTKRNKDTLFVSLWPGVDTSGTSIVLQPATNRPYDEYIVVVHNWNPQNRKYRSIDLPFRYQQLTASNIPFRVKLRDSTVIQSDFLNINLAYLWVFGKNRVFESPFVKSRSRSWGIGPYIGLSTIENPRTEKDEFGFNVGINIVRTYGKLNLVLALGVENGFKKETRKANPYFGFGLGFDLVELFDTEIKTDD